MTICSVINIEDYATRYLINSPFLNLYKEKGGDLKLHGVHHVSSWFIDYPSEGGVKSFRYENISSGLELVIGNVGDDINVSLEKMLDHILKNNGIPLSKDNLFMLPELPFFKDYLFSLGSDEVESRLIAPAHRENLINLQYLYYPCLTFTKKDNSFIEEIEGNQENKFHRQMYLKYTTSRVDQKYDPKYLRFAYFRKK